MVVNTKTTKRLDTNLTYDVLSRLPFLTVTFQRGIHLSKRHSNFRFLREWANDVLMPEKKGEQTNIHPTTSQGEGGEPGCREVW
jgi:hypothetical protein